MTFGDYYKNRNQNNMYLYKIQLQKDIQNKLKNSPSEESCKKLQMYLKSIIYPENNQQRSLANKYNQLIKDTFEQKKNKILQDFNIGNRDYKVSVDQVGAIMREKYESFQHKERIEINTIKTRLEKVKTAMTQVKNEKNLQTLEKDLISLQKMLESLSLEMTDGKGNLILKNSPDLYKRVEEMDALYQALSVESIVSPKDYGDILEYFLQALNFPVEKITNDVSASLIDDITKTAGSVTTGSKIGSAITFDKTYAPKVNKNGESKEVHISARGASLHFEYQKQFNENSDRQGKMDVELNLGEMSNVPFRISAKNWGTLKDLGSTSLAYALIRSLDAEKTLEYAYTLTDRSNTTQLRNAHELAKLAIVADIMMGYSQTSQYADTLVINHRAGRTVIVEPMKKIFNNIANRLNSLKINNYSNSQIQKDMLTLSRASEGAGGSAYFNHMSLKYLQSIHITLLYNSLVSV